MKSRLEGVVQWRRRGAGGPGARAARTHPRHCLSACTQTRSSARPGPGPGTQPCQVRVALKEDTSASYLTTCLIKFNGLVVPVKQTSTN